MASNVSIKGLNEILRRLEYLNAKGADKIACAMIRAQLSVIGKQMKADISPRVKDGRRAVKTRFKRNRKKNTVTAKVGFHVGKKRAVAKIAVKAKGRGVGISAANIHWWVAGTKQRTTSKANHSRGSMPAMQRGLARNAASRSHSQQIAAMVKAGAKRLKKELAVMRAMK